MRAVITIFILWIFLFSCKEKEANCINSFSNQYFYTALNNYSSSPNFLIVHVKNANTGIIKEICCESGDLSRAISSEHGSRFLDSILAKKPCDVLIELMDAENLRNVNFFNYSQKVLDSFRAIVSKNVFDSIKTMPRNKSYNKVWEYTGKLNGNYFEHLLIENGIGCKRDDETGYTIPVISK
jgi:hypothetical protein